MYYNCYLFSLKKGRLTVTTGAVSQNRGTRSNSVIFITEAKKRYSVSPQPKQAFNEMVWMYTPDWELAKELLINAMEDKIHKYAEKISKYHKLIDYLNYGRVQLK